MSTPTPGTPQAPTPAQTTSWAPTAKVSVGVLAAGLTTLILAVLKPKVGEAPIPAEVGAAITSVLTFIIQYLVPERKG